MGENLYKWEKKVSERVRGMTFAGLSQEVQADILDMSVETLVKYYRKELATAEAETIADISNCMGVKARQGDQKAQAFMLRFKGHKYGWQDKQIIEQTDSKEIEQLREQVADLEAKHDQEY